MWFFPGTTKKMFFNGKLWEWPLSPAMTKNTPNGFFKADLIEHMTSMSKKKGVTFRSQIVPVSWKKKSLRSRMVCGKKTSPSCWSVFSVMLRWRITASSLGASCNWIFVGMFWKQKFDSRCRPETIMATFNEADDFNVTFNLSEKYKNSKRSKATLIDMSICVPLSHCRPLLWPPSLCQHQQRSSGMAGLDQTWWHTPHG